MRTIINRVACCCALGLLSGCGALPVKMAPGVTVVRDVAYVIDGSSRQQADLFLPAGHAAGRPAVIVVHGGSWIRGARGDLEKYARRLANAGYVAMNVDYRLAPAHRYPAQIGDLRAALNFLVEHAGDYGVDPDRIGVLGYSAGAHLALLLGLLPDVGGPAVRAVVAGAGPADLTAYPDSPYIRKLIGESLDADPETWNWASPVNHVSPDDPPVLLFHGRLDWVVGIEQSRSLQQRLAAAEVAHEYVERPLAGHLTTVLFDGATMRRIQAFLARELAAAPVSAGRQSPADPTMPPSLPPD